MCKRERKKEKSREGERERKKMSKKRVNVKRLSFPRIIYCGYGFGSLSHQTNKIYIFHFLYLENLDKRTINSQTNLIPIYTFDCLELFERLQVIT